MDMSLIWIAKTAEQCIENANNEIAEGQPVTIWKVTLERVKDHTTIDPRRMIKW